MAQNMQYKCFSYKDITTCINLYLVRVSLSGEGSRSRRYGRTAALRLLVQPCDGCDDDDYYFLSFS
jgi:hypothetical protein